jgi:competence protein ComEC
MKPLNKGAAPLAVLLLPFLTGLVFEANVGQLAWLMIIKIAFGLFFFGFVILNITYSRFNLYKYSWLGGILIHVLLFLAGIICLESARQINDPNHFSKLKADGLVARICSEHKVSGGIVRFTAKVEQVVTGSKPKAAFGQVLVYYKMNSVDKKVNLDYGDELLLPANFTPVAPPLNPAEFDYKSYLAHQQIYHQLFIFTEPLLLRHNQGNPIISASLRLRQALVNKLRLNIADTNTLAVVSTMILGYRADLQKDVQEIYAKTGTMHLLAVAGMHVGLIYLLVNLLLAFMPVSYTAKIVKAVVLLLAIWFYALITGFAPAVCRATLMLSMVAIALPFNRHISKLNILALSAIILLLYNPFYVLDAGFQLSYLAVLGIILIQPYIFRWFKLKNPILREIWLVCSISIAVQLMLFPLSIYYFHDFQLLFLISNVFVIVPAAIIMYTGILYLCLPAIPVVSSSLALIVAKTTMLMTNTLQILENMPFSTINKIWITKTEVILLLLIIGSIILALIYKSAKNMLCGFALMLFVALSFSFKSIEKLNGGSIAFLSLNKNRALVLIAGTNGYIITDLKSSDKTYQYSVQPYLDSCGVTYPHQLNLQNTFRDQNIVQYKHLIRFGGRTIMVVDTGNPHHKPEDKLKTDYLLITGNPDIDLHFIKQNYIFNTMVMDGSNSPSLAKAFTIVDSKEKLHFLNLKRNKAFITASNN